MSEATSRTRSVRAGVDLDTLHGAVVPPLNLASTYAFESFRRPRGFDYSRSGNPTRSVLADALTALEGGAGAVVTASGMAAVTASLHALVPAGGRVVAPFDCYGGTWRLLDALARRGTIVLDLVDLSDPAAARAAITPDTDLVWVETPSNPLLRVTDLGLVSQLAHAVGALVVADNTFATPVLIRPLEWGADVVVHSTTKYLNGHSDVVAGAVIAADADRLADLAWWANTLGCTGGAFDAYLTLRGMRTLHLRVAAAQENAAALVEVLSSHPAVQAVHYPGLPQHPGHELAATQQQGFGAIVTFELADEAAVTAFLTGLHHFSLAESLGGVESLISHPASMTHAAMSAQVRTSAGITEGMLRLSVGVEDPVDLIEDLLAGLNRIS